MIAERRPRTSRRTAQSRDRFSRRGHRAHEGPRRARRGGRDRHARRHRSGRRQGRDARCASTRAASSIDAAASTRQQWSRPRPATTELSEPEEDEREVVRTKTVDAKPMTEEEAMLQLELLGPRLLRLHARRQRRAQRAVSPQRRRLRADSAARLTDTSLHLESPRSAHGRSSLVSGAVAPIRA